MAQLLAAARHDGPPHVSSRAPRSVCSTPSLSMVTFPQDAVLRLISSGSVKKTLMSMKTCSCGVTMPRVEASTLPLMVMTAMRALLLSDAGAAAPGAACAPGPGSPRRAGARNQ